MLILCWQQFGQDFEAEVWKRIWTLILVKGLRAWYCQGFETNAWSWFWSIFSLKTLRLNIGIFFEVEVWLGLWGKCLLEKCWHHLKARHMHVTEAKMSFAPPKIYFAALCGAFFLYGCCYLRSNTQNAAQIPEMLLKFSNIAQMRISEQHFAYLSNILHRRR